MSDTAEGPGAAASVPSRGTATRRAQYERATRRRSTLVAATSTVVVVALVIVVVPLAPGWHNVRASFFDGHTFRQSFPKLLDPFLLNLKIFAICAPCIVALGMLIAMARNVRSPALFPLKLFATIYTDVVRGVPVILWITLIGFGVPGLFHERHWYTKAVVWGGAVLGVLVRMLWLHSPRYLTVPLYIALGWVAVFVFPEVAHTAGVATLTLLVAGGVCYSVGAIIYALRRPDPAPRVFGYHEVFHAFTLVAACCHYIALMLAIYR